MSRVGNSAIAIPSGVTVSQQDRLVVVKGKNGELSAPLHSEVELVIADDVATVKPRRKSKLSQSLWGTTRAIINNMVVGVSEGYKTVQEFIGVGYRVSAKGQQLEMFLGFSHPIVMELPAEVKITAETVKGQPPVLTLESHDKQLVGQVAAKIRSFRKPEPYKGKGIRFKGEHIRRKAGKTAG